MFPFVEFYVFISQSDSIRISEVHFESRVIMCMSMIVCVVNGIMYYLNIS